MTITLIAGLGNPGKEYQDTRHNAGFMLVDALAQKLSLSWQERKKSHALIAKASWNSKEVVLAKPLTYMNESGRALKSLCSFFKIPSSSVILVYDDVTIDLGKIKVTLQGGLGGHNGVASVFEALGPGVIRYRIGIGGKKHQEMDLKDHVLSRFDKVELDLLKAQFTKYLDGLHLLVDKGPVYAMNLINQRLEEKEHDNNSSTAQI